jgi:hypothetical protein
VPPVKFTLRFYPGQDDDLLEWLDQFDGAVAPAKNQAIKDALRRAIKRGAEREAAPHESALDLAQVRQVVESALASVLARFEGQVSSSSVPADEDDEVDALLDDLGAALVLDKDEG